MTCIAWDGQSLSADSLATNVEMGFQAQKIWRYGDAILAITGDISSGLSLIQWATLEGEDPKKWPAHQAGEDWGRLIIVRATEVYFYEKLPVRQHVTAPYMAWGSGRDFAMGAMHAGASSHQAVRAAVDHCITCGGEVTTFHRKDL